MTFATRGDQTLCATGCDSAYYLLPDLRDAVSEFADFGSGLIPTDRS